MTTTRTTVLDAATAKRKIERIAWEIYERHIDESSVYIIGIAESGYLLAEKVTAILKQISGIDYTLCKLEINKSNPSDDSIVIAGCEAGFDDASVVVMDDVLNSGGTLIYAVKHILNWKVRKCTTAVLVDRNHKRFPIKADVKGLSLSTSMQERVQVEYTDGETTAYLS